MTETEYLYAESQLALSDARSMFVDRFSVDEIAIATGLECSEIYAELARPRRSLSPKLDRQMSAWNIGERK